MSFKEISELRKNGKLEDALAFAEENYNSVPDDIWNKRALGWVLYDLLKRYASQNEYEAFIETLSKLISLKLPGDEQMIFDQCAYQVGKMVFALAGDHDDNLPRIMELFSVLKNFHLSKPSESYSFLFKAFHKALKGRYEYMNFVKWWDFSNFNNADFEKDEFNGKKIISLVEQAYIAYAKCLLVLIAKNETSSGSNFPSNPMEIDAFLTRLDILIAARPFYKFPPYYKAKLLLSLGRKEEFLHSFIPFARQNMKVFWTWELLADAFENESIQKIACLCKSLSLNTDEKYLVAVRQKLADILVRKNKFGEAKIEIEKIIHTRESNGWGIPQGLLTWTEEDWFREVVTKKDNNDLYISYNNTAELILIQEIEEEVVTVTHVNMEKKILNFIESENRHGFFKFGNKIDNPNIGDILEVRLQKIKNDGMFMAHTVKVSSATSCNSLKHFEGMTKIIQPTGIGFVEDIFIEPGILLKYNIADHQHISGHALLSFNKKKNSWGWKAIKIVDQDYSKNELPE